MLVFFLLLLHRVSGISLPLNSFCMFSVPISAAVYPCSDRTLISIPYCISNLQAWILPCWATRCNAVWPWLSNAFTYKHETVYYMCSVFCLTPSILQSFALYNAHKWKADIRVKYDVYFKQ